MALTISEYMFNKLKSAKIEEKPVFRFIHRPYQLEAEKEFEKLHDSLIAYICWCRRAGKDAWVFYYCCKYAYEHPNARIFYIFPQINQGKKAILEGVTFEGERWIEAIIDPRVLMRPKTGALYFYDNTIRFKNGSIISIVGDDGDTLVGSNIDILVISEAALVKESTIEYLVPSVLKNKGKIICVSTPRYGSHFNKTMLDPEKKGYKSILRADQIYDNNGNRIYSDEDLVQAKSIMSKARYNSEYNVDLTAYNELSIYGKSLEDAKFISMPILSGKPIFISADLGASDNSSYTFAIFEDDKLKIINNYRNRNVPTQHYINYVEEWCKKNNIDKKYITIILPQDSKNIIDANRYLTSRAEFWRTAGFNVITLNHIGVLRGIEITRTAIETHDLEFVDNTSIRNFVAIIKAYEWKQSPNGDIIYVPKHGTGFSASNDADSLEYMNIAFFLDKYEKSIKTESGVIIN